MYLRPHDLFPAIPEFRAVDMVAAVLQRQQEDPAFDRLNPAHKNELLHALNTPNLVTYSGYGEDRSQYWKGTYMEANQGFFHLGVDINVRAGTPVSLPLEARVLHVLRDPSTEVGWGGRLIVQMGRRVPYIILGHLQPQRLPDVGAVIPAGQPLGFVGTWPENGNVFEHLHLQFILASVFHSTPDRDAIDGYGTTAELPLYPDPFGTDFGF